VQREAVTLLLRRLDEEARQSGRVRHTSGHLCLEAYFVGDVARVFWLMQGKAATINQVRCEVEHHALFGTVRI
jgi:hypothetical protein